MGPTVITNGRETAQRATGVAQWPCDSSSGGRQYFDS